MERPRRANAGRDMGRLISQEEGADEFYQTAYGGFEEASEDEEYETEEEEDDEVDSDFDVSEGEAGEEEEEEAEPRRKRKWLKPFKARSLVDAQSKPRILKRPSPPVQVHHYDDDLEDSVSRSVRQSTIEMRAEGKRRRLEEEKEKRRKLYSYKHPKKERRLTQEELLEEATRTETENLASLEAYARLEEEKKKVKEKKSVLQGPVIRFHSVSMPFITELPDTIRDGDKMTPCDSIQLEVKAPVDTKISNTRPRPSTKYCRNFLVFTDTKSFPSAYFPANRRPSRPRRSFCPITGLPAKYVDPLTGVPYATPQAFKIIRNRYVSEEEKKCEQRLMQLSSWLEEKKRKKLETNV